MDDPDEVGTAGACAQGDSLDGELRMRGQHVCEETADLDARDWAVERDTVERRRVEHLLIQASDEVLDRLSGTRSRQQLFQVAQFASILSHVKSSGQKYRPDRREGVPSQAGPSAVTE
jgi:hypothetical protein